MRPSLFDASEPSALVSAVDWLTGTLLGSVAAGLCVIAVAIVGFLMLSGRLAIREGTRVVLGCFILLGAPYAATSVRTFADGEGGETGAEIPLEPPLPPERTPPPANYDPYAGASVRGDQ